jgi:REP element-mobilizing transposase RayT
MSRNYKFKNPEGVYFVSFAVVNWVDVFTRNEYKDIVLDSIRFAIQQKSMQVFAWCIMSNHVHLVFSVTPPFKPEVVLGDIKRFSSRKLIETITNHPGESRKEWMLQQFREAGQKTSNTTSFQFWRHDNHPIELWSSEVIKEKINYIHYNLVEAGYVSYPNDYLYSSALDYAGETGLLKGVDVLDVVYDWKVIR